MKEILVSNNETFSTTLSTNKSYLIISDYYFDKEFSTFAPFLGGGIGFFDVKNMHLNLDIGESARMNGSIGGKFSIGSMLHAGFELNRFRFALEYNLIPATTMYNIYLNNIGKSPNGYLNMSLGFYLGGGKWGK